MSGQTMTLTWRDGNMKILRHHNITCNETYFYYGGFYDIDHKLRLPNDSFTTNAISLGKAKSNILNQAKKALNKPNDYKLDIAYPENLGVTTPLEVEENQYCDECGSRLTDGGYCPICDDNDEEYYYEER